MHMYYCAYLGQVLAGAVQRVVNRQQMLHRQVVDPFHRNSFAGADLKCGPRGHALIAPESRRTQITMNFSLKLAHRHAVMPFSQGPRRRHGP